MTLGIVLLFANPWYSTQPLALKCIYIYIYCNNNAISSHIMVVEWYSYSYLPLDGNYGMIDIYRGVYVSFLCSTTLLLFHQLVILLPCECHMKKVRIDVTKWYFCKHVWLIRFCMTKYIVFPFLVFKIFCFLL